MSSIKQLKAPYLKNKLNEYKFNLEQYNIELSIRKENDVDYDYYKSMVELTEKRIELYNKALKELK